MLSNRLAITESGELQVAPRIIDHPNGDRVEAAREFYLRESHLYFIVRAMHEMTCKNGTTEEQAITFDTLKRTLELLDDAGRAYARTLKL